MTTTLLSSNPVTALAGGNFTGRSEILQRLAYTGETPGSAYVGIDVHHYLSGLVQTVRGELELHGLESSVRAAHARALLDSVGFESLLDRNPLVLSGGEQAILALTTATLATHDLLAVDCALEQLAPPTRKRVIDVLHRLGESGVRTVLADNRLREFAESLTVMTADSFTTGQPRFAPAPMTQAPISVTAEAPWLVLEAIDFSYRRSSPVLRNLSFTFKPGHVYFLKGANGVGKSTLCKLLCGLMRPNHGRLLDERGELYEPWRRPGHVVAYHFQNPDLQLFSTQVSDEFTRDGVDIGVAFGLAPWMQSHPHDLPFVLRKRVTLAAAFARRRPWLVLDEPILGQDDATAAALAAMLEQLARNGAGVLVVTHSEWFQTLVPRCRIVHLGSSGLFEGDL